jgi:hypothetical protein
LVTPLKLGEAMMHPRLRDPPVLVLDDHAVAGDVGAHEGEHHRRQPAQVDVRNRHPDTLVNPLSHGTPETDAVRSLARYPDPSRFARPSLLTLDSGYRVPGRRAGGGMGPMHHHAFLWDGWVLMLPGVFVALVLATALALNGPGEALWNWVRAQLAPDPWRARWQEAVERHRITAQAFAEFECDLRALLRLPALADVGQPATARFVDAFAEANALRTDQFPGTEYARQFVGAVERAEQAWAAAVEAAERKRDNRFVPGERQLIAQVERLLDVAAASEYESERRTAYQHAQRRLAELERRTGWRLPRPAALALEHRARGMLAAASE